jgi:predicted nucleic acid-binding protein
MEFAIYLDVCCLNRPFDDQIQERIFLETVAVEIVLERCQSGEWRLIGSEAIDIELRHTPDGERKQQMRLWANYAKTKIIISQQIESRVLELAQLGFKQYDALHIACAEAGNANILLTTDDRMLRLATRYKDLLEVRVENPSQWIIEVRDDR